MKASPKLPFIVVIVIFSILFSSRCSCLFFVESLLYTQQNIYQNISLLKILWNYLSNEWSFALNGVQTRELCPFHFWCCVLSRNFQSAQPSMFWPYLLVGISDWLGSWFVGTGTSWSFWISKKIYCNFLLRSSRILMRTVSSCEFIRRCQWSRSCGLRSILLCILGFKVITIDSPASSMAPMVYLHDSCFA